MTGGLHAGELRRSASRVALVPAGELTHWWDGVDGAIEEYIELHRSVPGFRTLHFGDVVDVHLIDPERDNNAVIADHLADLLVRYHSAPDSAKLRFALTVSVEAAGTGAGR